MGNRKQGFDTITSLAGPLLLSSYDDYANARSILRFRCCDCGAPFETTAFLYKKSEDGKRCIKCKHHNRVDSSSARDVFIQRCKDHHGNYYDYSKVPDTFTKKEKVTIICPKHGEFEQTPDVHLRGSGCPKCKVENVTSVTRSSKIDFIHKSQTKHGFKYNYSKIEYHNAHTNVTIICPKHGEFEQTPDVHLRGSGCPKCIGSAPIQSIITVLERHNISYCVEKQFDDCIGVNGRRLRFDLFIPEKNLCVEYDGPHHFGPVLYGNASLEQANIQFATQQANDAIKDKFCEDNHIHLIRIPHTENHPDAVISKQLFQYEDVRFMYSWNDFSVDVKRIVEYIKSFNYENFAVYGVSRGGVPFAVNVSNLLDYCEFGVVSYRRYDGNDKKVNHHINHTSRDVPIFVIDDLISSGETMKKVISSLQHKYKKAIIHPIVIFGDENEDGVMFIREHPKQWIVFPYEV